ncbi:hypothetical protein N7532_002710 [Penicillium argentinense]|uniref:Alcohol acetyltransferase n=1 Tax=Penicillium argentinense TaxID=1131581 RepID=A0A9W9G0W4_9EURO|nr:uncharacterized protein N7532_002710 [Penicillium argentinense]KAJ5110065.1 hypothetical protein N7532_002710 [Penicillium argentinense]
MHQFERLRPVGRLEKYSTARHQVGFYLNVAVTANYILPTGFGLPIKDAALRACAAVVAEHPTLSAIPAADDTQEPYFVRLPTVDLDQVVQFTSREHGFPNNVSGKEPSPDQDLESLLQEEHNLPFVAPNAYWRLRVLLDEGDKSQFTAAFVFHHALGDGSSGKTFHLSFLRALQTLSTTGVTPHKVTSPQTPLPPNIEEIHPLPLSFWYLAKKIFQAKIYSPRDPGLWTGSKIQPPTSTRLRLVPFSKFLVEGLRKCCRQETTTVTALMQTVFARALFAHLPEASTRVNCTGAISCRRFLPDIITDESIGVYVADIEESYTRSGVSSPSSIWPEARRSRQTIEAAIARQGADAGPNLLKFVNDYQQELCLSKIGQDRDKTFEVSNIGVVSSTAKPEDPAIGGMVFSQCASVIGNAIGVSIVTGGDGCLTLAITWQECVVEDGLIEECVGFVRDELRRLAGCA